MINYKVSRVKMVNYNLGRGCHFLGDYKEWIPLRISIQILTQIRFGSSWQGYKSTRKDL